MASAIKRLTSPRTACCGQVSGRTARKQKIDRGREEKEESNDPGEKILPRPDILPESGWRSSFAPAHAAEAGGSRGGEALHPSRQAGKVLGHGGVGSVVHHGHAFGQRLADSRSAAQHKREQTFAQLFAEHLAHIEMQRKRGIKLVEHVVRKRRLAGTRRRCGRRRRRWS